MLQQRALTTTHHQINILDRCSFCETSICTSDFLFFHRLFILPLRSPTASHPSSVPPIHLFVLIATIKQTTHSLFRPGAFPCNKNPITRQEALPSHGDDVIRRWCFLSCCTSWVDLNFSSVFLLSERTLYLSKRDQLGLKTSPLRNLCPG